MYSPHLWQYWESLVVLVENSSTVYYNGEEVTAKVDDAGGGLKDGASPLHLGTYGDTAHWFKGAMDDVALFDTALTGAEIAKIYQVGIKQSVLAVSASGKLAVTWGDVKNK